VCFLLQQPQTTTAAAAAADDDDNKSACSISRCCSVGDRQYLLQK